jgi:hypothetical protein
VTPTQPAATPTERALTAEEEAGLRRVIDKSIADDYHYHPLTVKMLLATLDEARKRKSAEGKR